MLTSDLREEFFDILTKYAYLLLYLLISFIAMSIVSMTTLLEMFSLKNTKIYYLHYK